MEVVVVPSSSSKCGLLLTWAAAFQVSYLCCLLKTAADGDPAKPLLKNPTRCTASATELRNQTRANTCTSVSNPHPTSVSVLPILPYYAASTSRVLITTCQKAAPVLGALHNAPPLLITLFAQQIWLRAVFWRLGKLCMHFQLLGAVCTAAAFEPSVPTPRVYCHKKETGIQQLMSHRSCSASGCKRRACLLQAKCHTSDCCCCSSTPFSSNHHKTTEYINPSIGFPFHSTTTWCSFSSCHAHVHV